jgi:hypothetical protein
MMSSISDDIGVHGDALKSLIGSEEESLMSDLVVVSFKGEDTADQVLNKLREMQKEYLIDVEDACVVVRNKDGKVRLKQAINLVSTVAVGGAAWGGLFGSLIGLVPQPAGGDGDRHCVGRRRRCIVGRAGGLRHQILQPAWLV